jgi:CHAT domain-containing protein/tetratricopeptide (TPR) repeat protein
MRRCGAVLRCGIRALLAAIALSAPATGAVAAVGGDIGADELYWLAPAVVGQLPADARARLVAAADEVVAGRLQADGADAAVARALGDAASGADGARLARYVSWELRFVAGDVDLGAPTLAALAEAPCCGLGADWRATFATAVAERGRTVGEDPAAVTSSLVPAGADDAALLAVLAHANLDRGRTPAAQSQLASARERCADPCAGAGRLLVARARAAFFAAQFAEAGALAHAGLDVLAAAPRREWIATLPSLAEVAELFSEIKESDVAAKTVELGYTRADALLARRHPYTLWLAGSEFLAVVEDYESNVATAKHDAILERFGGDWNENALAVIELRIDEAAMRWLRGEYTAADELTRAAVTRVEERLGPQAPRLADALIVHALACSGLGNIDCVLSDLRRGLAIRESIYAFPHPLVAEAQNNLAVNLHDLGRYDLAEPLMQSVIAIDRAYYGTDNEEVASDIHNLASLYRAMGDTPKAIELLKEAVAIDERELGERHLRTGIMLNGLGQAYLEAREWQLAYDAFERSAAIQGAVDPKSRGVPIANHNRAIAALELGKPQVALDLLGQSLQRYEDPKSLDWRKSTAAHRELARAYAALGDDARADAELLRAATLAPLADAPEVHWRTFMALATDDAQRGNARSAVFLGKLGLDVLQQMRSTQRTLERPLQVDFLKRRADAYRRVVSWLVDLGRLSEAHAVRAMLGEEEYFEFTRRLRAPGSHAVPFTSFENGQRARLQAAWDAVHAKTAPPESYGETLAQVRAAFAQQPDGREPGRAELRDRTMPAGAALVDYVVDEERTTVLVLTANGRFAEKSAIARRDLRARVFELREALASPQGDPRAAAESLYATLLAPVAEQLEDAGVDTLWIGTDDVLRYLPFAALHDGRRYVAERYAVASVSPVDGATRALAKPSVAAFAVSHPVGGYEALPATELEVDAIVRTDARDRRGELPGRIWLNEAFDRGGLRDALGGGFDIVHVASHFEFVPGNETDSFLLLGTGERLPLSELRTGDYPLDRVDLLTMSGCDTVAASADADGREIDGFAALAASKGARHVLATLWSIDDEKTAALMGRFYGALAKDVDPVGALADARRAFVRLHPFYWAPFVVWGTPGLH